MALALVPGFAVGDKQGADRATAALAGLLSAYNGRPDVANSAELASRERKRHKKGVADEEDDLGIAIGDGRLVFWGALPWYSV
jgi:hypothetical protein